MIEKIKGEIISIKVHTNGNLTSKHKPLLLLLIFKSVLNGKSSNKFSFEEIDIPLQKLLQRNKIDRTDSKSTYHPFYYLSSSLIWNTNIVLKKGESPRRSNVKGKIGTFNEEMFSYLLKNPAKLHELIELVLELFWEVKARGKVRLSLNILESNCTILESNSGY